MALDKVQEARSDIMSAHRAQIGFTDALMAFEAAVREDERAATKERCRLAVGALYLQGCSVSETRHRVQEAIRNA